MLGRQTVCGAFPADKRQQYHQQPGQRIRATQPHIRRFARATLHRAFQHARHIGRGNGNDIALRRDDGGGAAVGGANHVAPHFQRARLRLLQLLPHGVRTGEPRHIAAVGEQGGLFGGGNQIIAEAVFIADIEGDFFARHVQRGLVRATALEIGQRHIHEPVQRVGDDGQRFVFAEGHQMVFGIHLLCRLLLRVGQRDNGVQIIAAVFREGGHAHRQFAAVALRRLGEMRQDFGFDILQKLRERGFGQHHDLRVRLFDEVVIELIGREVARFVKFQRCSILPCTAATETGPARVLS